MKNTFLVYDGDIVDSNKDNVTLPSIFIVLIILFFGYMEWISMELGLTLVALLFILTVIYIIINSKKINIAARFITFEDEAIIISKNSNNVKTISDIMNSNIKTIRISSTDISSYATISIFTNYGESYSFYHGSIGGEINQQLDEYPLLKRHIDNLDNNIKR
jgi:predicted membrane protein